MSLSEEDAQAVLDQMKAEDEAESRKDEEHKSSIVAIDLDASAGVPQPLESLGVSDLPLPTARKRAKSVSEEIAAAVVARLGDEALPILGVALASLVVLLAASPAVGVGNGLVDYAFSVGVVSLVCALVLSALHRWRAADLRRTPLTDARAGPISVLQLIGVFLVVWWIPGAGVLTFVGPFVVTSNGYFGAWAGLLASLWLLSLASSESPLTRRLEAAGRSGTARLLLLACAVVVLIASCASAATAEGALGIAVAAVTIVFVVMYGVLLQSCAEKCSAAIRRAAALLLLALWVVAAGVLTFRGPFVATGNGYFGTWLGFACALAFAWQEFY